MQDVKTVELSGTIMEYMQELTSFRMYHKQKPVFPHLEDEFFHGTEVLLYLQIL